MEVNVKIYGKIETVEASPYFWLKMLTACREAACYNQMMAACSNNSRKHDFSITAKDYVRLHDEIFKQTRHEILKIE